MNKAMLWTSLVVSLIGLTLCFLWFGWKLAVVFSLLLWGNNLSMKYGSDGWSDWSERKRLAELDKKLDDLLEE